MIPDDWDHVRVGDVARVKGGKRLPAGFTLVETPTPHPYVRVSDMYPGGVDPSAIKYVPEAAFYAIQSYRIYDEDIFISVAGTLGIVGVVPPELSGANLTENADRITDLCCDRDYLKHWLMSGPVQQAIESIRTVGAQPKLALGRIAKFDIALPQQLSEQRVIAEALSDVDALIAGLEALIAKKRAMKQGAMQQLLTGKMRLPGFSGEWETKRLVEDVALLSGHHVMARDCNTRGDGTPYLTGPADFPEGRIQQTKFTVKPTTLCRPGDILVTVKGSGCGTLVEADGEYCISRQLMAIRTSCWNAKFLFYSLLQNASRITTASTGLIPGLSRADILEQELPLPSEAAEQTAIATVLSDMDAEITALEARRDKTHGIKQGTMQQLLTGRVRLVKPSQAAGK